MPDRRTFLKTVGLTLGAVLIAPAARGAPRKVAVRLDRFPPLREVGGAVTLSAKDAPLLLVRDGEASVRAFDATCTHQGCVVGWDAASGHIVCPCHGSTFDLEGAVVKGPASRRLKRHDAVLDGDRVIVTIS